MNAKNESMISFRKAHREDIPIIQGIAQRAWQDTYAQILSVSQFQWMFEWMYSEDSLCRQMEEEQQQFFIAFSDHIPCGYLSIEQKSESVFHFQKVYVDPVYQGKGVGKSLLDIGVMYLRSQVKSPFSIKLNVNRENKARYFYEKNGFLVESSGDFHIGHGYYMNDYIMVREVSDNDPIQLCYQEEIVPPTPSKEELFPVVTPLGLVVGCKTRAFCHSGSKVLHPVVHLHVFNAAGQLYLQKRSINKDIQPGKWDTAVGGHVDFGESFKEALYREAKEELGITLATDIFLFSYPFESTIEKELVSTYATIAEGPFAYCPKEIDEGRFWDINEIKANIGKGVFTPNFEEEFSTYLLHIVDKISLSDL